MLFLNDKYCGKTFQRRKQFFFHDGGFFFFWGGVGDTIHQNVLISFPAHIVNPIRQHNIGVYRTFVHSVTIRRQTMKCSILYKRRQLRLTEVLCLWREIKYFECVYPKITTIFLI